MSAPVPFQGRIPVSGHTAPTLSAWASTGWSNDAATVPGQNPAAWSETNWADDDDNAVSQVFAGIIETGEW